MRWASTSQQKRSTMVKVLPVPGPAAIEVDALAVGPGALPAGQVVEGELDVVELRPEVGVVGAIGAVPSAGLVVDDLAGALAGVVDAVDLAVDLGASRSRVNLSSVA